MTALDRSRRFWNRVAPRYAARPLRDVPAYEAMLAAIAARLSRGDRVLEIGCGTGGTAIRLAPGVASWLATDLSAEMVRIARAKPAGPTVHFEVADAAEALGRGPFEAVCAINVLHLVEDLPGTLAQIHAGLAPGGQLIARVWCFGDLPAQWRVLFRVLQALRLFPGVLLLRQTALREALGHAGFEIVEERSFGSRPQNPFVVARKPPARAAGAGGGSTPDRPRPAPQV
ncbi:MAG: class I SAM-dependent methyltransferase [Alkalilacustris sp.]